MSLRNKFGPRASVDLLPNLMVCLILFCLMGAWIGYENIQANLSDVLMVIAATLLVSPSAMGLEKPQVLGFLGCVICAWVFIILIYLTGGWKGGMVCSLWGSLGGLLFGASAFFFLESMGIFWEEKQTPVDEKTRENTRPS